MLPGQLQARSAWWGRQARGEEQGGGGVRGVPTGERASGDMVWLSRPSLGRPWFWICVDGSAGRHSASSYLRTQRAGTPCSQTRRRRRELAGADLSMHTAVSSAEGGEWSLYGGGDHRPPERD